MGTVRRKKWFLSRAEKLLGLLIARLIFSEDIQKEGHFGEANIQARQKQAKTQRLAAGGPAMDSESSVCFQLADT